MKRIRFLFFFTTIIGLNSCNSSSFDPQKNCPCGASSNTSTATISIVPLPPPPAQPVVVPTLPLPTIITSAGVYAVGQPISVSVQSLPVGALLEISADSGRNWLEFTNFKLLKPTHFFARVRDGNQSSENIYRFFDVAYKRVLILGNSMMWHSPLPDRGWLGSWGMAASALEKDFVHLLTAQLQRKNQDCIVETFSMIAFENNYQAYNYGGLQDKINTLNPDLVIIRIGDNVDNKSVYSQNFEKNFGELLDQLATKTGFRHIVSTEAFWNKFEVNYAIYQATIARNMTFCRINDLYETSSNTALGLFNDPDIAQHPSDKGMKAIADRLWKSIN